MQTLEPLEVWVRKSLDAGAGALRAVIDGHALPADDLIAGVMAIDWLTPAGRYAPLSWQTQPARDTAPPFDLYDLARRVRALLDAPAIVGLPEGRAEAGRLLPMFERIRADQ